MLLLLYKCIARPKGQKDPNGPEAQTEETLKLVLW